MFVLNGNSSDNSRGPKNDWPLEVTAHIIKLTQDGLSAREAFQKAVDEYNATSPKVPLVVPPSVEGKYAASVLWGMRTRFEKKCNNPKAKDQKEALAAAAKYGIGQEVPSQS